ncbi:hypothetical protein CRUP_011155 [Coryphaenoides rupestris]|nr:hypothetical protein CRUP_011155 [Coryphaenoides rupestris]
MNRNKQSLAVLCLFGTTLVGRRSSHLLKHSKQVETLHEAQEKMKELPPENSLLRSPSTGDEGHNQSEGLVAKSKEVLYHGKLFVSEEHICFHSSVLLKDTKVVIRTSSVCELKRHKIPLPMLSIHTVDEEKYHLLYVKNSGACYELLKSVCLHVELRGEYRQQEKQHFSGQQPASISINRLMLFLLISGYIGLRIVALEARLTALGDFSSLIHKI